ncbi:MAG: penicillin-binding protein 1C, partial [Dolichospermum sp.]|nr:penicillin-binding protein 1C [Dolichospermum sp.]
QKLEFTATGTLNQPMEWWLNDQHLSTQSTNGIFWHLQPGNWKLEARYGKMRDQINFQVELGNIQPRKQGFSVANPTKL